MRIRIQGAKAMRVRMPSQKLEVLDEKYTYEVLGHNKYLRW